MPRWLITLILLSSCAVEKKGILVDVEPGTPMDETDLHQHCDLGDQAACVLFGENNAGAPLPTLPLIQGMAPPDRATFAVLQSKEHPLFWYIYDRDAMKLTKLFTPKPLSRGNSAYALQRLDARGLLANRSYELLAGDAEGRLVEDRSFRPLATDESHLRAEIITGWGAATHETRLRLLAAAHARMPQFFVLAGSSANTTLPPEQSGIKGRASRDFFFERHAAARASFELGLEHDLVPVAALWNEDEFGKPNGGISFPQRDDSREMMELFFPHWSDETSIVNGPGISVAFDFKPFELIVTDDLSFRQPPAGGGLICHKAKGHKHEVCKREKLVPAPPGTRYGMLLLNWVSDRSKKAGRPLWLLAGGPNLVPYTADWQLQPGLQNPALSLPPEAASLWELRADRRNPPTLTQLP